MTEQLRNDLTPQGYIRHMFAETENGEFKVFIGLSSAEKQPSAIHRARAGLTVCLPQHDLQRHLKKWIYLFADLKQVLLPE